LKAKVFLNRAMDPDSGRAFDEQVLWAAAALELLGKAALARVSPLLIAEPTEEGTNILIATGLMEGDARFVSVRASTIFKRCQKAFRPFSADAALKFADARNEYLHGPGLGLVTLPPHVWWPQFWALASILITAQDRDLEELVGLDRIAEVEGHLDQNTKNIEHRTEALIERAKQRLQQYRAGTLPAKIQTEWQSDLDLSARLRYNVRETCPACGATGTLEGADSSDMTVDYDYYDEDEEGEPYDVRAIVTVPPDYFSCPNCHLVLDRYELIQQAGLPETFEVIDEDPDWGEPEYGND
jgi:hypothetical protein